MHKLPYIADKNLYAAVIGACSYVRIAQGNGQKIANSKKAPRKYYYFAVSYSMGSEAYPYFYEDYAKYTVIKATRPGAVLLRFGENKYIGQIERFDTEEEAQQTVKQWANVYRVKMNQHREHEQAKALVPKAPMYKPKGISFFEYAACLE